MTQALTFSDEPVSTPSEIAELLGQPVADVAIRGTGLRHLFVDVGSVDRLRMVQLDHEQMAALGGANGVDTIGLYAACDDSTVRLRDITAPIGVLEEPASGTTCGALGLLRGRGTAVVEQGVEMGRPSRIVVRATPPQVTVTGTVRRVLSGILDPA